MNLLDWAAKEIKAILPRIEEEAPPPNTWGEKSLEHGREGDLRCSISVTNLAFDKPYIALNFLKGKKLLLRIPLLLGGAEERLLSEEGKDMMKLLRKVQAEKQREKESPFIFNPLYITPDVSVEDIEAQIALRLLQEGGEDFSDLIKTWVVLTFPRANRIDDLSKVVEWLRGHFFLPEDWRAFRKYVKKIVDRFVSQGRKIIPKDEVLNVADIDEIEEMGIRGGLYPVSAFGMILNISPEEQEKVEGKLYRWAREGKIRAKKKKGFVLLDIAEVRQLWERKKQRKALTKLLSDHLEIDQDSARKWIKRQEMSGLSFNEIIEKAKEKISNNV